jgi:hypothetical protein
MPGASFSGRGGGIFINGPAILTLTDVIVRDNHGSSGGGIDNSGGTVTITNSTLRGNSANDEGGGGIYNEGTLMIANSTLAGNAALDDGDSIFSSDSVLGKGGSVRITNSIVANDRPQGMENCSLDNTINDGGFNIDTGTTCGFTSAPADPGLDPDGLKDHGGPTQTIALCTGAGTPSMGCTDRSPAIDMGDTADCGVAPNNIDQRGFVRPVDGGTGSARCDIGAFESGALPPPVINSLVDFVRMRQTRVSNTTGCPAQAGFVGTSSFSARLTNQSTSRVYDLMAKVITLTNENVLQNADGAPGGVGAILTIPQVGQYSDGVLGPGEFVDVPFVICLKDLSSTFNFEVDVPGLTQ